VHEAAPLPFPQKSVDVVLASGVLEYFEDPVTLLEEFRRITRKWIALTRVAIRPVKPSAIYWQTVRHKWGVEEHCLHAFNRSDLERMIARAGLAVGYQEVSTAGGVWLPPDESEPTKHYSLLLEKL
jgi:ubiquinone/menaquinone biosynthesis C-methylase UbiE